jgi:hypothetical protein
MLQVKLADFKSKVIVHVKIIVLYLVRSTGTAMNTTQLAQKQQINWVPNKYEIKTETA